jgi:predicted acylesterase/phospholipase RssA
MASIGVAMSGGGHRASLFGMGVLLYLAEAGKNREVGSVASVSGGSLANGFVAQSVDYRKVGGDEFREQVARPFVTVIAQKGTVLPPNLLTGAYLLALGILVLGAIVGVWFLPWPVGLRVVAFFVALALVGLVAALRGTVTALAFRRTLFSPEGSPTRLAGVHSNVDHVFCATDLHAGENVYFSKRFVCSFRLGWGEPGDLKLEVPVQASACLPGAFPPRWLRIAPHRFQQGRTEAQRARWMVLVDGGVYDNMADQWALGIAARKARWPEAATLSDVDELIVVNSSGGLGWQDRLGKLRWPFAGELLALVADKDVLYDNGNSVRRQLIVDRFRATEREGHGLRGALVHIPQSPLGVADAYLNSSNPELAARARTVVDRLGPERERWDRLAEESATTKTSLSKLGVDRSASLVQHAYMLAMANLHVLLGYPWLDPPARERFEDLAR